MLGRETGAIASLLRLLKHGSSKAKETAAEALENLALNDWNKTKIVQEGGIECLTKLLENGTSTEQEAATATLKVLKTCTSFDIMQQERIDGSGDCGIHEVEPSNQPTTNTSGYAENVENGEFCKSMGYENGNFMQEKEITIDVASTTTMDELQHSNNHIYENLQTSKSSHLWQKNLLKKNLELFGVQNISTSELTSTLAPPLIGQPSIQVDAILENIKKPVESNLPNNKRMKMATPHIQDNQNANRSQKRNNTLAKIKAQNCNPPTIDSMHMRVLDTNKRNLEQVSWIKNREILHQKSQCFSPNKEYGLVDTIRDQQTRQCLVVDNQLVAGGIVALVNALSSPNPSAQEFAALALMLLASQGGFEVKTAVSDAGIFSLYIVNVKIKVDKIFL